MNNKGNVYESMLNDAHLLIVGATGTGKSVLINALIYHVLQRTPEENQLILIDPKRVELFDYKDCPHTLTYASKPEEMVMTLEETVKLMDDRYEEMQAQGLKKTNKFNIYVIIDEYADLMDVSKDKFGRSAENNIIRLAQLGRAAGIHLIAATQNATTLVVNSRIKSNFPARVVLKTAFKHESTNVIGIGGAEKLPRYGKGYYLTGTECSLIDINMISDDEIKAQIDKWSKYKRPDVTERNYFEIENTSKENDSLNLPEDDLTEDAIAYILTTKQANVSMLQKRFRIGYNRASRILDEIVERGILGDLDNYGNRSVLVTEEEYYNDSCDNITDININESSTDSNENNQHSPIVACLEQLPKDTQEELTLFRSNDDMSIVADDGGLIRKFKFNTGTIFIQDDIVLIHQLSQDKIYIVNFSDIDYILYKKKSLFSNGYIKITNKESEDAMWSEFVLDYDTSAMKQAQEFIDCIKSNVKVL